jgi:hypothetical protein
MTPRDRGREANVAYLDDDQQPAQKRGPSKVNAALMQARNARKMKRLAG